MSRLNQWVSLGLVLTVLLAGCSSQEQPTAEPVIPADESVDRAPTVADSADPAAANQSAAEGNGTPPSAPDRAASEGDPPEWSLQESLDNQPPPRDGEAVLAELGYVSPADQVRAQLADPPGATRLSQQSSLWVDVKGKRVFADGYVAQREAYLEMFACPAETKEHESIVGVMAMSSEVHAALLAVGAMQGTPVRWDSEQYIPATGQPIRVWVMWYDEQGNFQSTDARRWVRQAGTEESLDLDWVFVGSSLWKDPSDGKEYYQADGGEMICVSNFSTALLDLPVQSSDQNNELQFDAYTERIPPQGTPVRLMLVPLPSSGDQPDGAEPSSPAAEQPPTEQLMPLKQPTQQSS